MSTNANLHKAKDAKNDEFYTQLTDVSKELIRKGILFRRFLPLKTQGVIPYGIC